MSSRDYRDEQIANLQQEIASLRQSRGYSSGYHSGRSSSSRSLGGSQSMGSLGSNRSDYFRTHKTVNGYGEETSQLCVSEIGSQINVPITIKEGKRMYRVDAKKALTGQKLVRSAKSMDIMNGSTLMCEYVVPNAKIYKNIYPETRNKLQKFARDRALTQPTPRTLKEASKGAFSTDIHFHPPPEIMMRPDTQCRKIKEEAQWNKRELEFNRSKAAQTEVHDTLTGNFKPSGKALLLPVGANHQQILGIDNKLVGGNPNVNAPAVKPALKWYGDTVGWGGNNGLKSKEAQARFDESVNAITKGDEVAVLRAKYEGNQIDRSGLSTAGSVADLNSARSAVSSTRPW